MLDEQSGGDRATIMDTYQILHFACRKLKMSGKIIKCTRAAGSTQSLPYHQLIRVDLTPIGDAKIHANGWC